MKILLVGEFSGFHRALKLGLQELDHEVILAGSPDGFKSIPIDVNLWPSVRVTNKLLFAFFKQISIYNGLKKLPDVDVVQFISPMRFHNSLPVYGKWFNSFVYQSFIKKSNKSFLVACGNDPVYSQIGKNKVGYNPLDAESKITGIVSSKTTDQKALSWNIELAKRLNGVIPASYDYRVGYETFSDDINLSSTIPMPIMTSEYEYSENILNNGKIRILHGITRPEMKGTPIIMEALEMIKEKYPDELEIRTVNRLTYAEYLNEIQNANCLIDQCNSYGYGINALVGLAMGKVVMSGAEPEELNALNVADCSVINIRPDADDIYSKVEQLIVNKHKFQEFGAASRKYVEEVHDAVKVAERYVKFWSQS